MLKARVRCEPVALAAVRAVTTRAPEENSSRTPIAKSGTRKATDPGTHMMTPAAAWSASGDTPASGGISV